MQSITVQHYRVTLEQAKQDYKDGLLTATGLVYYAIAILRPPGQKLRIPQANEFVERLAMSKTAFYRALSKLKLNNQVDWEPTEGLIVWIPLSRGITNISDESRCWESQSQHRDSQSQHRESETLKPCLDKDSENPPDITDIYQIFLSTLTNVERENFEIFSREAIKKLPSKPVLSKTWIEKYHKELWKEYKGTNVETKTEIDRKAIAPPTPEQITKLQELEKAGEIKKFYPNSQKSDATILVDTGSGLMFWWEFFEMANLEV